MNFNVSLKFWRASRGSRNSTWCRWSHNKIFTFCDWSEPRPGLLASWEASHALHWEALKMGLMNASGRWMAYFLLVNVSGVHAAFYTLFLEWSCRSCSEPDFCVPILSFSSLCPLFLLIWFHPVFLSSSVSSHPFIPAFLRARLSPHLMSSHLLHSLLCSPSSFYVSVCACMGV